MVVIRRQLVDDWFLQVRIRHMLTASRLFGSGGYWSKVVVIRRKFSNWSTNGRHLLFTLSDTNHIENNSAFWIGRNWSQVVVNRRQLVDDWSVQVRIGHMLTASRLFGSGGYWSKVVVIRRNFSNWSTNGRQLVFTRPDSNHIEDNSAFGSGGIGP